MAWLERVADKAGLVGSIVSAAACVNCFPALASLGAAIGLGVLSPFEGVFIRIVLPVFAGIALLANALGWLNHRQWWRTVLGVIGPVVVLTAVFLMRWSGHRTGWLLYPGLILMVVVSIWDLISPAPRVCATRGSNHG
ncbi:MAG: organomercurial transporter MerC [Rhodanobacter sp.]